MITIKCYDGLCNRLRFIFSWRKQLELDNFLPLRVLWPLNKYCADKYSDVFCDVPGIEFIYSNIDTYKVDHIGMYSINNFDKKYSDLYNLLNPHPKILSQIYQLRQTLNKYNAVHIRRTDHISLAKSKKQYISNHFFEDYIKLSLLPVYVATDDADTQTYFAKKYPTKVKIFKIIKPSSSLRQTNLEHSIIDLYMCIYAENFMPYSYSSFSDIISHKRMSIR